VYNLFKKASSHNTSEEEKERLLHFVIAGGGPTGVETAAEVCSLFNYGYCRHCLDVLAI
jgi:NADH dehydrogenase FAD-containing subunit